MSHQLCKVLKHRKLLDGSRSVVLKNRRKPKFRPSGLSSRPKMLRWVRGDRWPARGAHWVSHTSRSLPQLRRARRRGNVLLFIGVSRSIGWRHASSLFRSASIC